MQSSLDYVDLGWELLQLYLNPKQLIQNIIWYFSLMYDSWIDGYEFFTLETVGEDAY